MSCKLNEISILKSSVVKLDDENIMLLTLMCHTADKNAKKAGEDASFYRYEGTVMKLSDYQKMIDDYSSDAHAMEDWTWMTKASWWKPEYYLSYYGDKTKKVGAKWYKNRLSKMLSWDDFLVLAKDGVKKTRRGTRTSENSRYQLTDYVSEDGTKFDITSPEDLVKNMLGKCFGYSIVLKRDRV